MSIEIRVDTTVNAAYIRLSENAVVRTVDVNDQIMVDVDEYGVAVGIEVLDEGEPLPFQQLVDDFHVHSDVVELLRLIRPNVASFLRFTQGSDGVSSAEPARTLQPA